VKHAIFIAPFEELVDPRVIDAGPPVWVVALSGRK
jgi:hypothetical protein